MAASRSEYLRNWVEGVWNHGDNEMIDRYITPEYVMHEPTSPQQVHGPEAFKQFVALYRTAIPDFQMTLEEVIGDGDRVAWRFSVRGTHTGSFLGAPPTGNAVDVTGLVISQFDGDRWLEDYVNFDTLSMLQQFGILPQLQPVN